MKSVIAATALAVVTTVLGAGMLWSPSEAKAYCPVDEPCPPIEEPSPAVVRAGIAATGFLGWESRFNRAMYRMDLQFRQLAGAPTFR